MNRLVRSLVLRHTHATGALAAGVDIATVADLLRHKGLRTVMIYATVQDTARRTALAKLGRLVPSDLFSAPSPGASTPSIPAIPPGNDNVLPLENSSCVEEPFDAAA